MHYRLFSGCRTFASLRRLTGGLPDVGKQRVVRRNLIRAVAERTVAARGRLQGAVIAVSVHNSDRLSQGNIKGSTRMGPPKHRASSAATGSNAFAAGCGRWLRASLTVASLAIALFFGLTVHGRAQGAVRAGPGDWQR